MSALHALFALFVVLSLCTVPVRAQQAENSSQSKSGDDNASITPAYKPRDVGSPYVELDSWIYPWLLKNSLPKNPQKLKRVRKLHKRFFLVA